MPCSVLASVILIIQVWSDNFRKIYDLQAAGKAFETPEEMLVAMGVFDLTQIKASDHMKVRNE